MALFPLGTVIAARELIADMEVAQDFGELSWLLIAPLTRVGVVTGSNGDVNTVMSSHESLTPEVAPWLSHRKVFASLRHY